MAEGTKISWCDATFNPWIGCSHVSEACRWCYAETMMATRYGRVVWGPNGARVRTSASYWKRPYLWNARCARENTRLRVFSGSLCDVMDEHLSILPKWRSDHYRLIGETTHLEWLLLTKRPHNWPVYLPSMHCSSAWRHVRLGVTIEDEKTAQQRTPWLELIRQFGWRTFVSYEPAIGPVDWRPYLKAGAIGWLIAGGESGSHARPAHQDWFRQARDQCAEFGVPFHFKQWGEWLPSEQTPLPRKPARLLPSIGTYRFEDSSFALHVGRKLAGAFLDGSEHHAFP